MHIELLTGRGKLDDFYGVRGYLESVQRYTDQSAMRALLAALRADGSSLKAFGMTHMHELGLRAIDDESAPELVKVRAVHENEYHIEYLMPDDIAPWTYCWVRGEPTSTDEAAAMVAKAMGLSGGWPRANA